MWNVTSKDFRKKEIVYAFKKGTGATKITLVKEGVDHYQAHCQIGDGRGMFTSLGFFLITKEDFDFCRYDKFRLLKEEE